MTTGTTKRSVMIAGHRTSVSLETPFWQALREIAAAREQSVQVLTRRDRRGAGRAEPVLGDQGVRVG